MKLAKTILAGVWWLGRGTATVMGLAVLLALTVGLASTALAGTGVGARFDLGKINKVNAVSTLVGSVDGPVLTVENSDEPFIRTFRNVPLSLETRPDAGGHRPPPLQIDSDTLVQQLNADLLDGKGSAEFLAANGKANDANLLDGKDSTAFVPTKIYEVQDRRTGFGNNNIAFRSAKCDPGDLLLSGGAVTDDAGDTLLSSFRSDTNTNEWIAIYKDGGTGNAFVAAEAHCADSPPLR